MSRRRFLVGAAGVVTAAALPIGRVHAVQVAVHPRDAWGAGLPPTGPLEEEAPGDVRFLLLHHSASPNSYGADDVPGILGSFYRHHTGTQGWADIAYNFLIDRYGGIWEGRAGSLAGPVKGDATGGSQGFAMLACFIGDHSTEAPTPQAVEAMAGLCAGLAHRYGIDTTPGATARFVSRGSSKHPQGAEVITPTIAGHRDMSETACPGDAGYALITGSLPGQVASLQAQLGQASAPEPTPTTTPLGEVREVVPSPTPQAIESPDVAGAPIDPAPGATVTPAASPEATGDGDGVGLLVPALLGIGGLAAAAAVASGFVRARGHHGDEQAHGGQGQSG